MKAAIVTFVTCPKQGLVYTIATYLWKRDGLYDENKIALFYAYAFYTADCPGFLWPGSTKPRTRYNFYIIHNPFSNTNGSDNPDHDRHGFSSCVSNESCNLSCHLPNRRFLGR